MLNNEFVLFVWNKIVNIIDFSINHDNKVFFNKLHFNIDIQKKLRSTKIIILIVALNFNDLMDGLCTVVYR